MMYTLIYVVQDNIRFENRTHSEWTTTFGMGMERKNVDASNMVYTCTESMSKL